MYRYFFNKNRAAEAEGPVSVAADGVTPLGGGIIAMLKHRKGMVVSDQPASVTDNLATILLMYGFFEIDAAAAAAIDKEAQPADMFEQNSDYEADGTDNSPRTRGRPRADKA